MQVKKFLIHLQESINRVNKIGLEQDRMIKSLEMLNFLWFNVSWFNVFWNME